MSLLSIRAKVAAKLGLNPSDANQKALLTSFVNEGAEELWKTNDLVGALREVVLSFDGTQKQIALPYYVLSVKGIRWADSGAPITQNDMRPRYQSWDDAKLLNWRDKNKSPLHTAITDESTVTLKLPIVEAKDVIINIIGRTPNSSKVQEKLTIPAGQLSVESTNNYVEIYSITKSATNTYDITVYDVNSSEISKIPNAELSPRYTIVQILDDKFDGNVETSGVEVLYKPVYRPLIEDYDEFQAEGYDDAVFWKVLEVYQGRQDDDNSAERAKAAAMKVTQLCGDIAKQFTSGKKLEMNFKPNPLYNIFRNRWWNRNLRG